MTVAEARQVTWLSTKPKPLGELLDEGYLDRSRLEWAAKKAYNPRLKKAAQVLLESPQPRPPRPEAASDRKGNGKINPGIGLEEAKATPWPFGAYHGKPMGALSDARQISLKDLAHAFESARDERVRRSAAAMLLNRLGQEIAEPPPAAGPLNVVQGGRRSFAQRRQLWFASVEGMIGGGVLGIGAMLLVNSILRQRPSGTPRLTISDVFASPDLMIALLVVIVGMLAIAFLATLGLEWLMTRLDRQIEAYRKGEEGEETLTEIARRALDGNWTLFRNLVLPGRSGDIDLVLVGPPGVWAIEVKNMRGKYRIEGDLWEYRDGHRWRKMKGSPTRQARDGAIALKNFLRAGGINTYIPEAVGWASSEAQVIQDNSRVAVWTIDHLEDELGNLANGRPLSQEHQAQIVEKLTKLCRGTMNQP